MAQGRWVRIGLGAVAMLGVLVGTPVATAGGGGDTMCPAIDGWIGPTADSEQSSDEFGGAARCWYEPGPGSNLGSSVYVLMTLRWAGDAENGPEGAMPGLGCGRDDEGFGYRTISSDGTYAYVHYEVGGTSDAEAVVAADEARFQQAVAMVMPQLEAMAKSCTSTESGNQLDYPSNRTAGATRYDTASQISSLWGAAAVVYVATGQNFPDALGGGPAAGVEGGPILLVERDGIPVATAAELTRLGPLRIVVLGGTGAISDGVVNGLRGYADTVDRVAGLNRYETAVAVSAYAFPDPSAVSSVFVATGRSFADPIIAGAAAALADAPLLLVDGVAPLESVVRAELERLAPLSIVLVGSDADVGNVAGELGAIAPVTRINQSDVYARSAALYDGAAAGVAEVVLATSSAFADALAGTPYAAADPVSYLMLSRPDCIPAVVHAQIDRLAPGNVKLLGGTAALSPAVESLTSC